MRAKIKDTVHNVFFMQSGLHQKVSPSVQVSVAAAFVPLK